MENEVDMETIKFHPLAEMFPPLSDKDLLDLAMDIEKNGQLHPIIAINGQILDGCNRYRACKLAGIEPIIEPYEGISDQETLIRYVISSNLQRRQLTPGQKAMLAVQLLPQLEAAAKERQRVAGLERAETAHRNETGQLVPNIEQAGKKNNDAVGLAVQESPEKTRSIAKAAEITGANKQYVSLAKQIGALRPDLAQQVTEGKKTIPLAMKELEADKGETGQKPEIEEADEKDTVRRLLVTIPLKGSNLHGLIALIDRIRVNADITEDISIVFRPGAKWDYEL